MPMELSPGEEVKIGTPARYAAATKLRCFRPACGRARVILPGRQILADQIMEFGGAEGFLKRLAAAKLAIEAVGAEQVFVIEDDVVDADHLMFAQGQIVESGRD